MFVEFSNGPVVGAPNQEISIVYAMTNGGNMDVPSGITVSASATKGPDLIADPFMDSDIAGLGVCSGGSFLTGAIGVSQCSTGYGGPTHDDNLLSPEMLTLTFNKAVKLLGLQIRDKDHKLISGLVGAILIGGNAYDTGANGQVQLSALGAGSSFTFTSNGTAGKELYLSVLEVTAVPLPAAGFLLLGSLGGLGFMARRKRKSA